MNKKIINNKLYILSECEETKIYSHRGMYKKLYKTKKGNYLLYNGSFGDFGNGEYIEADIAEVKSFLAKWNTDLYLKMFGDIEVA